jgi:adenosylmethionine-8-amino-7-oxononanoate aminotransferase
MMTVAGVAVLDYFAKHDLVGNAAKTGARLLERLRAEVLPLPGVGAVEGLGLLTGIEFVAEKDTRAPFPRGKKLAEGLIAALFAEGVVVWPNVGQANGTDGDLIMIGPPLVIDEAQIDELVSTLARVIGRYLQGVMTS